MGAAESTPQWREHSDEGECDNCHVDSSSFTASRRSSQSCSQRSSHRSSHRSSQSWAHECPASPLTPPDRGQLDSKTSRRSRAKLYSPKEGRSCATSSTVLTEDTASLRASLHSASSQDVCFGASWLHFFRAKNKWRPQRQSFHARHSLHQVDWDDDSTEASASSSRSWSSSSSSTSSCSSSSNSISSSSSSSSCSSTCKSVPGLADVVALEERIELASLQEPASLDAAIAELEQGMYQLYQLYQLFRLTEPSPGHSLEPSPAASRQLDACKASILHKLGNLQWKAGRYELSLYALIESITLYQSLLDSQQSSPQNHPQNPPQSPRLHPHNLALESAHALLSLGRAYLSKGSSSAAMRCYHQCVSHISSLPPQTAPNKLNKPNKTAPIPTMATYNTDQAPTDIPPMTPTRLFAQACSGAAQALAQQHQYKPSLRRLKRALKVQLGLKLSKVSQITPTHVTAAALAQARVPLVDVAETLSHMGTIYELYHANHDTDNPIAKQLTASLQCHTLSLEIYRSQLGPHHIDVATASHKLAHILNHMKHYEEAHSAYHVAHTIYLKSLGMHRNTASTLYHMGLLRAQNHQHDEAMRIYHSVLEMQCAVVGKKHTDVAATLYSMAMSLRGMKQDEEAQLLLKKAMDVWKSNGMCHSAQEDYQSIAQEVPMEREKIISV